MPSSGHDVERLLTTLMPALAFALGGGCDQGATPAEQPVVVAGDTPRADTKSNVDDGAKVDETPEPVAVPKTLEPTPVPKTPDPAPVAKTPDPAPVAKTPDPVPVAKTPDPVPVAVPDIARRPRPTCPSGTWCTDKATATSLASGGVEEMSCPANVGLKPGKPIPDGFPMNITGFDSINTKAARDAGDADACCYAWYEHCPGGRPLLDTSDQPVVAPLRDGRSWSAAMAPWPGPEDARRFAAEAWLADAAMEHASVASFGRVALELLALGAPPELIEDAHHAAIDEIRHAKTCFDLARACGAAPREPAALPAVPQRTADLARFAADTFVEGCVGETTAALAVARAARGVADAGARESMQRIADDEGRHAALAWRMLSWAVATGGAPVLAAVRGRAAQVRDAVQRAAPRPRRSPDGIAGFGRLSAPAQAQAQRDAWRGIIDPMLATLSADAAVVGR